MKTEFKKLNGRGYDLVDERFGKLVVNKRSDTIYHHSGGRGWECTCDCSNKCIAFTADLMKGHKQSCGCLLAEVNKDRGHYNRKENHPRWKGCGELSGKYWATTKRNAEKRDLEFNITIEYAWKLFEKQGRRCALTGRQLHFPKTMTGKGESSGNASIDRIDSNKGYIEGNVQWVDKEVNLAKMAVSEEKFFKICKEITDYQEYKNLDLNKIAGMFSTY